MSSQAVPLEFSEHFNSTCVNTLQHHITTFHMTTALTFPQQHIPTFQPHITISTFERIHQLLSPLPGRAAAIAKTLPNSCHDFFWTLDAVSLALFTCNTTSTTHCTNTTDNTFATPTHSTGISLSTTSGLSHTATPNISSSTTTDYSNSNTFSLSKIQCITLWSSLYVDPCTCTPSSATANAPANHISATSTSPILPGATIAPFTTYRPRHRHPSPAASCTSTSPSGDHTHRTPVAHATRGMATLFSFPPSYTTCTTLSTATPAGTQ